MDASNPSNLRRSSRLMAAKKRHGNYVLPARELERDELHVSCLPPEVLTRVFRWLPVRDLGRVPCVCAGWRDLIYHKSLWSDVTFKLYRKPKDLDRADLLLLLDSLLLRGIQKIEINHHTVLHEVAKYLPHLHCVFLQYFERLPMNLSSSLFQRLTNLIKLEFYSDKATDKSIQLVAEHLKKLVTLKIHYCSAITSRSMEYIAMGMQELKNLYLHNSDGIGDLGVGYLCGIGLNHPPAKLLQLQCLSLSSRNYSDLTIRHLSTGQPFIQQLYLCCLGNFSDAAFQWLATMRELRHLDISSNQFTGSGLVQLANANSPITYLDLNCCRYLTDQSLEYVGRLKQLRTLILDNNSISDAGLEQLVKGGGGDSPISTISLWNCYKATDERMRHVAQLRQLHQICCQVGDVGLAHLADALSPVAILECTSCVTNMGLSHVARLPNLQSLGLTNSCCITGAGLKEFVANVRGPLTELNLLSCYFPCHYDEVGLLECVARGLPNLTKFQVYTNADCINWEEMVTIARLLPRLNTLIALGKNIIEEVHSKFDGHFFH